jgi:hypothetical protein
VSCLSQERWNSVRKAIEDMCMLRSAVRLRNEPASFGRNSCRPPPAELKAGTMRGLNGLIRRIVCERIALDRIRRI